MALEKPNEERQKRREIYEKINKALDRDASHT
jgi:hypothetical protein